MSLAAKNGEGAHTKGPWEIKPEEVGVPYIRIRGSIPGGKYKVCNAVCESARDQKEARANARLIAAAPDLLEALERLTSQMMVCDNDHDATIVVFQILTGEVRAARAAIAKAKEAQP